jgi:hypothetical protein
MGVTLLSLSLAVLLWSNYSILAERHALNAPLTPNLSALMTVKETDAAPSYQQFVEYSFYNEQGTWKRDWLQCDRKQNVSILLDASDAKTQRYLSFKKSQPAQKKTTTLALKQDADCAMQKCWWTLTSPSEAGKIYAVEESHYIEPDDGFWTRSYDIGTGASDQSAEQHVQPCRWFSRTRAAVITERRSLYITETETGRLVLRVYDYKQASNQPSLSLKGGTSSLNSAGNVESFTFKNKGYTYVINLGAQESYPLAEVLVKRGSAVIFKDQCLSYSYLKKS